MNDRLKTTLHAWPVIAAAAIGLCFLTQGVAKLVVGRKVEEVISLLKGIQCRNGTSCPDQLAQALEQSGKVVV